MGFASEPAPSTAIAAVVPTERGATPAEFLFVAPHGGVERIDQLPDGLIPLSGTRVRDESRVKVLDDLLQSVALLAYPLGGGRFATLRLSAPGWSETGDNIRHSLAINDGLQLLGRNRNLKFDDPQVVEASRAIIAEINGVEQGSGNVATATTARESRALMRGHANEAAKSSNQYTALLQELLTMAVRYQTADIHIFVRYDKDRAGRNRSEVQFRIDGDMVTMSSLSSSFEDPAQLRAMIGWMWNEFCANGSETQFQPSNFLEATLLDQVIGGKRIRGRVKTFDLGDPPSATGDSAFKLVMRIIYVGNDEIPTLESLGLLPDVVAAIERHHNSHRRMLCISGPVGSGKSTTLRSAFAKIPKTASKYSVEDPIENLHPGTAQINAASADAMERVVRGLKRGDLNALLMGEVRTPETLDLVVNIVLSGHPCYTTTHSDTAIGQIGYFLHLGIDTTLLAHSAVLGLLMHQGLVKKLCTCAHTGAKAKEALGARLLTYMEKEYQVDVDLFKARNEHGCDVCRGQGLESRIGYHGRHVVVEYFEPDMEDRMLIERRDLVTLERRWRESRSDYSDLTNTYGNTLLEVGMKVAQQGIVDLRSVQEICGNFEQVSVIRRASFVPAPTTLSVHPGSVHGAAGKAAA